ncbi:hypothetical protein CHLNCDRAFT_135347 [Chlorella variabilis]|uniref:Uncharacterized protein n=1 Tax=Chlorella variabilis TaxID=554065 RepID=E1ZI11_CHLVA|nr:hypothetical protein CHLNCDRAFT_135347 [Chlorella variabilis]EFN54553.1 hypothetical protein CHLNCDRAFT_135347 [Chlorella variabilis]|eukprot:XP_005846655.1 hypothetical protein CHLNCDRAFT_135347 [Chlorella variabilis]
MDQSGAEEEWFAGFKKLSLAASPPSGRRASLGFEKRLSSAQAPDSHPVSPASSERGGLSPPPSSSARSRGGSRGPASPATSHFSIPAYRSASTAGCEAQGLGALTLSPAAPTGAAAAAAAEERVTLNLFVQDDPQGGQACSLRAEVASLQLRVGLLQAQLDEAQQLAQHGEAAAAPAAAPLGAADAAGAAVPAAESVQLVLTIVEAPSQAEQGATVEGGAGAADPAGLQQQLQRVEASRDELGWQAGQLRGRIAKLEGAVLAGESRVRAQAAELEALKAAGRELEQQLAAVQAQVGVTPDRARAERRRLAEQAAEAQAAAEAAAARAARLAAVLAFEARERRELGEFAALEHQLLAERERVLTGEAAQWRTDAAAAASQLADVRQRLVKLLRGELEAAQAATAGAAVLTAEWRHKAEQFDRDRQAAAANIRKAERELELVAQDNERMFRQLNFVRTRLMGQLGSLDPAVPDIGKLARELQSWCDREAAVRHKA